MVCVCVGGVEDADDRAGDGPNDLGGCPLDVVGEELVLVLGGLVEGAAVVGGYLAFAEVVGLGFVGGGAEPFEVDLVGGVGDEDDGADNAGAGGGFHGYGYFAEHDVEAAV